MCKYEMDPTSIVEDIERTRFCPQTDRWTDRRMDDVKPVDPPLSLKQGYDNMAVDSAAMLLAVTLTHIPRNKMATIAQMTF